MTGFYDILSIRNRAVKELFRLRVGRRRARSQKGLCLVRGRQLVQSIGQVVKFKEVFTFEPRETFGSYHAEKVVRVQKNVLQHVLFGCKAEHAKRFEDQDFVIGTAEQPPPVKEFAPAPRRLLMIDRIKHPENMGRLLTSAVALKFDGVMLHPECVDPFSYKVLDASQAVAWTLPYCYASYSEIKELAERHKLLLCAGSLHGQAVSELPSLSEHQGFCLIIGNEAEGVQQELLQHCLQVSLPMSELMESLNASVAGGILMHSLCSIWNNI
ncbi:unnamed protein product [Durusdinium trenchii]|uniref:tRNA/rRNA methyltransferase SpoU type domain-containing protein n=1 Tax=Durusdinium trenchii TaxID=1381693 RepID=A0ABP0HMI5_9DINO